MESIRRLDGKRPGILGVGSAVPSQVLSNQDLERMVDTSDQWILERSGIRERRIAPPGVCTSDLAAEAAVAALADAGTQPSEIDLVIVATVTPDTIFPATSCLVQHRLGMMNAAAFDLSVGCTGFIYGLSTASQFVANGTCRKVLVIGADLLSRITDWEDRNTCVLFGDGAGAVVVGETENGNGILSFVLGTDGSGADLLKMPAGGSRQPASHDTVDQRLHYLKMEGREVFKFAVRVMSEATREALQKCGLSTGDIDLLIPHQANIRIIEAAAKRLGLPEDKVIVILDKYGNNSAATIPIALDEAHRTGRLHDGSVVALVAFGAGLSWAACALRWGNGSGPG